MSPTAPGGRAKIHALILAGGAGERFWPASRRSRPKPFLQVIGGRSLLDATLSRARRFAAPENVWIVCGHEHAAAVRRAAGLQRGRLLVEPRRRNTALAIAWATQCIRARDPEAIVAVLPADHHIPDERAFARDIREASRAAAAAHCLVTLGVVPTRADTGYGYIRVGAPAGSEHPRLHRAMAPLRRTPSAVRSREALERTYRRAPSLPIDVAVMERSRRVWTLPVDFRWSDVGTWASLAEELGVGRRAAKTARGSRGGDGDGNRVIAGDVLLMDASDNLIWGGSRLVALLGVEGLAVVDTGDVTLITRLDRSADVRNLVAELKKRGRTGLT